jgi:DNA-binding transcriptional LysR family regulator
MGKDLPPRNLIMHVSSFVSIPSIIAQSDLIAIVPKRIAQQFNQNQQSSEYQQENKQAALQCLVLPFSYPQVKLQLLWHKSREHDMAHQWVRERMANLINLLPK